MRIIRAMLFGLVALAFGLSGGQAQEASGLRALITGTDSRDRDAVGRLDLAGGFCTGALVSGTLVRTAAHCVFHARTGRRIDSREMQFLAGWRDGRARACRGVRRTVVHPGYAPSSTYVERISRDLALIELDLLVRDGRICPFVIENGEAQIVSVVSAMAELQQRKVSIGTSLEEPLAGLLALLEEGDGVFRRPAPAVRRASAAEARRSGSARFVRPQVAARNRAEPQEKTRESVVRRS